MTLAWLGLLLMVLSLVKKLWRSIQARREIRLHLTRHTKAIIRIKEQTVWRNCGSAQAAFLSNLSIRNYTARYLGSDGSELSLEFEADFHPISAKLRRLEILNFEPIDDSGRIDLDVSA